MPGLHSPSAGRVYSLNLSSLTLMISFFPSFLTVPVSVPAARLVTVAVNVALWPNADELADELIVVVVLAGLTVWVNEPVLPLKFASPP